MTFEADNSPTIFSLKWTKHRAPMVDENEENEVESPNRMPVLMQHSIYLFTFRQDVKELFMIYQHT